jgi:hypothetical protein
LRFLSFCPDAKVRKLVDIGDVVFPVEKGRQGLRFMLPTRENLFYATGGGMSVDAEVVGGLKVDPEFG